MIVFSIFTKINNIVIRGLLIFGRKPNDSYPYTWLWQSWSYKVSLPFNVMLCGLFWIRLQLNLHISLTFIEKGLLEYGGGDISLCIKCFFVKKSLYEVYLIITHNFLSQSYAQSMKLVLYFYLGRTNLLLWIWDWVWYVPGWLCKGK